MDSRALIIPTEALGKAVFYSKGAKAGMVKSVHVDLYTECLETIFVSDGKEDKVFDASDISFVSEELILLNIPA
ncbi:MAG: hypothetical protein HGA85_07810 [Nanoarchaeota archaeon]|nr:hypothetical protein [Nanoarchaeota archaeon]